MTNNYKDKIILLVRSYNRPEYLEKTLQSLAKSDIDLCEKRYIYDDYSTNKTTRKILNDPRYVNIKNKEFSVIYNTKNAGCKYSYLQALHYIKMHHDDCDFICTIDNDVLVKHNFIAALTHEYKKAFQIFQHTNILFTGFNPTNKHNNIVKHYQSFYTKNMIGGVNFFFHRRFLEFIYKHWKVNLDYGVCNAMNQIQKKRFSIPFIFQNNKNNNNKYAICCTVTSYINHIGVFGLNSTGKKQYDVDENFMES